MRRYRGMLRGAIMLGLLLGLLLGLAGCNFSTDRPDQTPATAVAWATPSTATPPAPSTTPAPGVPLPTLTAAPTITAPPAAALPTTAAPPAALPVSPTNTPFALPALPTFTSGPVFLPTLTAAPTITAASPVIQDGATVPPAVILLSETPPPTVTPLLDGSGGAGTSWFAPPSFTPVVAGGGAGAPTSVAALPGASVCPTCDYLRLRDAPGTAGSVLTMLSANAPLSVIGRTLDSQWVQVVTQDGKTGWVSADYLVLTIDLNTVGVSGAASDLPGSMVNIDVVSGVSSNARQIFLNGLARGNSPHVFTRVGDSITAAPQFLTQIGSGTYSLGDYGYLGTAIRFFSGPNGRSANPFVAASLAARNGWGTTSILDPANADPNVCRPGETPLACEYRLVRPSVALIMVGTNDSGGLPTETFRANLQAIVQISINMGVIPVLSTVPPKHYNPATDARVDEFNQVIVATARAYDVPLWNYYAAMNAAPGQGLAPDGVHPSTAPDGLNTFFDASHLQYGYNIRNLTALQVLYTLWQYVLYDGDTIQVAALTPSAGDGGTGTTGGTAYDCPGALPPQLSVGGLAHVTPGLPNKVRSEPTFSATQIGSIPGEGVFSVLGGPRCADGYTWWQVNYNGLIGWTAQGDSAEYWIAP